MKSFQIVFMKFQNFEILFIKQYQIKNINNFTFSLFNLFSIDNNQTKLRLIIFNKISLPIYLFKQQQSCESKYFLQLLNVRLG
jgi:hypothetical protein